MDKINLNFFFLTGIHASFDLGQEFKFITYIMIAKVGKINNLIMWILILIISGYLTINKAVK
jgi:hypothetical protein